MTVTEFINKTDSLGGLIEMYKEGYEPDDLDLDADDDLYDIVEDAWEALDDFFDVEDEYYTYCEECRQEG